MKNINVKYVYETKQGKRYIKRLGTYTTDSDKSELAAELQLVIAEMALSGLESVSGFEPTKGALALSNGGYEFKEVHTNLSQTN